MSTVGIITQARTTSTRLPGKVLLEVAGKSLLEHHLDRLGASGIPVYVATTTNAADDLLADIAVRRGLGCHRGSEHDVLSRFDDCARENGLDVVVRVTSDCPLIDGRVIASAVEEFLAADNPYLYLSNTLHRTFPRGFDFELFSAELLAEAASRSTDPIEREHVTPYLYANRDGRTTLRDVRWPEDRSSYRVTIDTQEDLDLVRKLIEEHNADTLDCAGVISILDNHPELVAMNADVEHKLLGE
jgi:spore coat polysaccharide biosynthesis protein SpsF